MSRIRSHLDSIISGDSRDHGASHAPSPRPAFPRASGGYPSQPAYSAPQPASRAVHQPAPHLEDIHKSLDQLASRISAVSRNNAPRPQASSAPQAAAAPQIMPQEIREEIQRGFSQIRQELGSSLDHDLKRIADGIAALQNGQNLHPDYADQMHAELQNLSSGIRQIAEMQSSAPASQVDLSGVSRSIESGYSEIVQKLDQVLAQRGDELPALPEFEIPDYSNDFKALATRVEEVARAVVSMSVSAGDAEEHHALERIEARLVSLAKAVEAAQAPEYSGELAQNFAGLEERIATLADRLDGLSAGTAENQNGNGLEILSVLQELVGRVEAIEQLATQAAQEDHAGEPGSDGRISSLEHQLSAIASQLGSTSVDPETGEAHPPMPGSIAERLENIEGQIAASRDIVIDMASQAAQAGGGENAAGLEAMQLSQFDEVLAELRQLREVNTAGERGTENIEGIAEAIQAISARLDQMEMVQTWPAGETEDDARFQEHANAQPVEASYATQAAEHGQFADHDEFAGHDQFAGRDELAGHELPEIQDAPPLAPEHDITAPVADTVVEPGMPDPAAAYPENQDEQAAHTAEMAAPAVGIDAPEAEAEDVPLEPGSGMPDLESLVRRATNRKRAKNEPSSHESGDDDGINDLMAAARRAAQAASAQVQSQRDREAMGAEQVSGKRRFSVSKPSIFSRKALLTSVAVIALAYAGWAIVPKFLGGSNDAEVSQTVSMEEPLAAEESAGEEMAVADEDAIGSDDAAMMDAEQPAGDDELAEAPEMTTGEEMPESDASADSAATMPDLEDGGTETMPAMASGSESIAIPDGMSEEIGNTALLQDAAAGDGNAIFEIARRYTEGDGVDRDLETAADWYQKAAELGHGPSQYRLGNFYEKGHGVTADTAEAAEWYSKAAAAGNALAMHNLAVLNVQGLLGSDPDMTTAIGWFEKAANLGVKDSQVNLGILYTRGMGVNADLEQAYKWFAIAAKGGDNDAAAKRDTVAKNMRPEQLEKARGEAEIWKPKTLDREANTVSLKESWKTGSKLERATISQTELVKRTQAILTRLGFDPGPADGIMGAKTEEAIKAYQQKSGLPVDGRITPALLEALSAQAV